MHNTHHTKSLASKAIDDPGMHPENRPEAYERLSTAEQAALLEWIRLAIKPAKTRGPGTSYGIKHAFEERSASTSATAGSRAQCSLPDTPR